MQSRFFAKNKLKIGKISLLLGVLSVSGYLFYLTFIYKDPVYALFSVVIFALVGTLSGKIGFLNRQITIAFHKSILNKIKGFRGFHFSATKLDRAKFTSLTKSKDYRRLFYICVGYLLIHIYVSCQFTINVLNAPKSVSNNQPVYFTFLSAIFQQFSKIWKYEFVLLIVTFFLVVSLYILKNRGKGKSFKRSNFAKFVLISSVFLIISYFIGGFAAIQYSNLSASSKIDSISSKLNNAKDAKSLNIIVNDKEILDSLKKSSKMPNIIGNSDKLNETIVLAVFKDQDKRESFYNQILLPSVISNKKIVLKFPSDVFLLPDGSLIIKELKKDTIEAISPTLGRLMVRKYFNPKYIKEEPQIQVMGRQEYLKFREDQINKQLVEIGKYIANTQSLVNTAYANINEDKQKIEANKTGLANAINSKDSDYNYCKTAGYTSYYFGFYRYYTDAECEARRQKWDQLIAGFQKNITDWEQSLKTDQFNASEYQKAKDLLVKYQNLVEAQKDSAPGELGLFESPDKIKVVLESTSDRAIADYFAIVAHEYLHYSSYVSEERLLPQFFEEGLTEFYSRQIVADQIKTETNIGYPTIVPIIKKIAQDLPKEELERIYFTKDEKSLIALLNQKYGDSFYQDSEYYFKIIPFLNPSDALEIVNNILFKIGAPQLAEQDLYSKPSSFKDATLK